MRKVSQTHTRKNKEILLTFKKKYNKSSKFENFLIDNPNKKLDGNYSIYIEQYAKMLCITECNAAVADLKHDRYSIYSVFCI